MTSGEQEFSSDLDIEVPAQLSAYLQESGYIETGEEPSFRRLEGGVSNRAVWVDRAGGESWVVKQALSKLRVAADWFSSPERIHREALGIRWLERLAPAGTITPLVFEDHANHILAMQAVPQPHENWKALLLEGHIELEHVEQFGRLLGTIHREATNRSAELAPLFDDRSFFESLRLEPYYAFSAEVEPKAAEFLNSLIQDTRARRLTLVHGDYSPKNVLVYQGRLILLDHEVVHWGDPAFDLGFGLTHLLSKAHHDAAHRDLLAETARHFWRTYLETLSETAWAAGLEPFAVRHTLACLLARIVGRSPLEYLTEVERALQKRVVLELMTELPAGIDSLVDQFIEKVNKAS